MAKKTTKEAIYNTLEETVGSGESSKMVMRTDLKTGKSQLIISKEIREYYPVSAYEEVKKLHEDLNRGGGRRCYSLKDLTK